MPGAWAGVLARFGVVLLRGSWVVISGVIRRVTIVISPIRGLITLLFTSHEPPSTVAPTFLRFFLLAQQLQRRKDW